MHTMAVPLPPRRLRRQRGRVLVVGWQEGRVRIGLHTSMLVARAAAAERIFAALPPSHRHEYLRWIGEAKRAETRRRRATKAAEMMVEKHGEASRG